MPTNIIVPTFIIWLECHLSTCFYSNCSYAIVIKQGYNEFEEVLSTVTTKVEGLGYTNGTGRFENAGNRVWDSSDYVIPPQVCMCTDHMMPTSVYCILLPLVTQQCVHHD